MGRVRLCRWGGFIRSTDCGLADVLDGLFAGDVNLYNFELEHYVPARNYFTNCVGKHLRIIKFEILKLNFL